MDSNEKERAARLALNTYFGFRPRVARFLIDSLGSASALFELSEKDRNGVLNPFLNANIPFGMSNLEQGYEILNSIAREDACFLTWLDEEFPSLLQDCPDAPVGLYVKGNNDIQSALNSHVSIGVVGTRDMSLYGREWCARIIDAFSKLDCKPLIISGLALGIDYVAHTSALDAGLPTIGVLPCGIDNVYPSRHLPLANAMENTIGCSLVTDYPPATYPMAINFLRRNRIIAGLSSSVILIESKNRGGALMTVNVAASYGRDVYAVPGRLDDVRSSGCNKMIKEKKAEIVSDIESLLRDLDLGEVTLSDPLTRIRDAIRSHYSAQLEEKDMEMLLSLVERIAGMRGETIEEMSRAMGLPFQDCLRLCMLMETDGYIETDLLQRCTLRVKNF